jgi:hypothetical protein
MSEKRVEELLRRLDETLIILKDVLSDLQEISKSLRSATVTPTPTVPLPSVQMPQPAPPAKPAPAPAPAPHTRSIKDVQVMFPSELEDLLTFTEKEGYIIIKPRQYLGSENFAKIASIIRGAGGEYISAGKDSHFRIPKQYE